MGGKLRKEMEYERGVDTTALQFYMRLLVERVLLQESAQLACKALIISEDMFD